MEATVQMGLRPVGRPGKSPLIPPSQPAGSPRGQDRTNYLPNCMVLKAPRHPRAPFLRRAAVCMTDPPTHPLPSPPLQKKERKKKDTHTHKTPPYIYIYISLPKNKNKNKKPLFPNLHELFTTTCALLSRGQVLTFNNIRTHRRMPCTHSYKQTSDYMK